jgi:tRNA(Ile)-lysidine synthase
MKNLTKQVQNTAHQYQLWNKKSKIVIGVSGGPDSVCLLDIFFQIKKTYDLEIIIAHVNYKLRGKDSDADEKFVRQLAKQYAVQIEVFIPHIEQRGNLENQLRDIRYAFFEKIRQQYAFDLVAVAHNLDDQAETFLMRLLRGSGNKGLSAMQFKSHRLIRPLLATPRHDILEYLAQNKLAYRIDKTNDTSDFYRNKIRNQLIPILEESFNPNIKKTLFNATLSISEDEDFLIKTTNQSISITDSFSIKKIIQLHPSIQKRALRDFIIKNKFAITDIYSSHIEELLKIIRSNKGKNQIFFIEGLKIIRKGDTVTISKI